VPSIGFGLFKSLIDTETPFSTLIDNLISEEHFKDDEVGAYRFIREFVGDYGRYPRLETLSRTIGQSPAIFDELPDEYLDYWLDEVKQRKRYDDLRGCLLDMRTHLENQEIEEALNKMGAKYLEIRESYSTKRTVKLRDVQQEVLQRHDYVQQKPGIPGVSFGFPYLDRVSGGAQDGDFIIIVGQTGVGKTYLAFKIGYSSFQTGKKILVLSTEMPNLQSARRVLAMEGHFSTDDLKKGRLSYFARKRAEEIIANGIIIEDEQGNYFNMLPGGMFPNVDDFIILVKELKPDMAIVDGAYLLKATAKSWWERNMDVATSLKNLALTEGIPVLATYQYLKKDAGKLEGVGGGFAIPQIASMVISFEFERKEDMNSSNPVQTRILRLTKGRDGEFCSMRIEFNMKTTQIHQKSIIVGRVEEEELLEQNIDSDMDSEDFVVA